MALLGAVLTPTMTRWRFVWNSRHPAEVGKLKMQGLGVRAIARQLKMRPSSACTALQLRMESAGMMLPLRCGIWSRRRGAQFR